MAESVTGTTGVGHTASLDHHVDPTAAGFGATALGVETGGEAGRIVTGHSTLLSDDGPQAGYLDRKTESLYNVARVVRGEGSAVTPEVSLGPTLQQQALLNGLLGGRYGY